MASKKSSELFDSHDFMMASMWCSAASRQVDITASIGKAEGACEEIHLTIEKEFFPGITMGTNSLIGQA
jgi:hypothetical protein